MIDAQARPKSHLRLMSLVVLLGIVSAALSFVFMALIHEGTRLICEQVRVAGALVYAVRAPLFAGLLATLEARLAEPVQHPESLGTEA
jgi:hypothetical protein